MRTNVSCLPDYNVVVGVINIICGLYAEKYVCDGLLRNLIIPTVKTGITNLLSPTINCRLLKMCSNPNQRDNDYINRILANTPPRKESNKINSSSIFKILAFGDVHADKFYTTEKYSECHEMVCCSQSSTDYGRGEKCGKWGTLNDKASLPYTTLDNFIDYAANIVNADTIFWLGDNPSVNVWDEAIHNHLEPTQYISQRLKESLPSLGQVYPILGNHEGFPINILDVHSPNKPLYAMAADLWRQWLTEECILIISV
jgi:hypothetical protein